MQSVGGLTPYKLWMGYWILQKMPKFVRWYFFQLARKVRRRPWMHEMDVEKG